MLFRSTQVYLTDEDLKALHRTAAKSNRSVASLVRDAVRTAYVTPVAHGPVGVWSGKARRVSVDHDSIYDER